MPFSEPMKLEVKRRADFTCCWCQDRRNKVEVHHIIPEAKGGADEEDNAAPLCGSCHDLYGGNPGLRKEIKLRRDRWYEICMRHSELISDWSFISDIPLLDHTQELPQEFRDRKGIQLTDQVPGENRPTVLYVSVYYKPAIYRPSQPEKREKWLSLSVDMRFAFHLGVDVCAWDDHQVSNLMQFLHGSRDYCDLFSKEGPNGINYFGMFRKDSENRLVISTITPTRASLSIRARFSERVAASFADYLDEVGFAKLGW